MRLQSALLTLLFLWPATSFAKKDDDRGKPHRAKAGVKVKVKAGVKVKVQGPRHAHPHPQKVPPHKVHVEHAPGRRGPRRQIRVTAPKAYGRVKHPAEVTGFAPSSGPPSTVVTIRGRHLDGRVRVRLDRRPLEVLSQAPNMIQVRIPAGARSGYLSLHKPGGPPMQLSPAFNVVSPPRITSFHPRRGYPGTVVTLRGRNFIRGDKVLLGNLPMEVRSVSPNALTVVVPQAGQTGRINIRRAGQPIASAWGAFVVQLQPPVIHAFRPTQGPPGTVVEIQGEHFGPSDRVLLAGRPLSIKHRNARRIAVLVGRNRSGHFEIRGPNSRRAISTDAFAVVRPPHLRRFRPRVGRAGDTVTVWGANFQEGDRLFVGEVELPLRSSSGQRLVAELTPNVAGGRVSLHRGPETYYAPGKLKMIHPPRILSFSPTKGHTDTVVHIHGEHIDGSPLSAFIGAQRLRIVRRRYPTDIWVRIPRGSAGGRLAVVTPTGRAEAASDFRLLAPPLGFTVRPRAQRPGRDVTLTLSRAQTGAAVRLNGLPLPKKVRDGGRRLIVTIPARASSGHFEIVLDGQTYRSREYFRVLR